MISKFTIKMRGVPKARPRVYKGRATMPKAYTAFKNDFAMMAAKYINAPLPIGPEYKGKISMQVEFFFKTKKHGDLDNLVGAVMDALNKLAYYDDRQINELRASIGYGDEDFIRVTISCEHEVNIKCLQCGDPAYFLLDDGLCQICTHSLQASFESSSGWPICECGSANVARKNNVRFTCLSCGEKWKK